MYYYLLFLLFLLSQLKAFTPQYAKLFTTCKKLRDRVEADPDFDPDFHDNKHRMHTILKKKLGAFPMVILYMFDQIKRGQREGEQ